MTLLENLLNLSPTQLQQYKFFKLHSYTSRPNLLTVLPVKLQSQGSTLLELPHFHVPFWLSHILVYLFYLCPCIRASVAVGTEV